MAAPGAAASLAQQLAPELEERLNALYPDAEWHVRPVVDGLVAPPATTTELIDAAHQRLLREDWELALCLTDLPLRMRRRAVVGLASPTHRVALVSVPALGAARIRRRALDAAIGLLSILIGEAADTSRREGRERTSRLRHRLVDLAELADENPEHGPTGLAALVRGGRLRLLWGMVRANRPWLLAASLYRALIAALATVVLALVTDDVWRIAESLSTVRLTVLTLLSVTLTVASLIAVHGLWEHHSGGRARDQVTLFNAATAATVVLGVLALYIALVLVALAGAGLIITPDALAEALGTDAGFTDYLKLAWFVSSLATVAGALGAGLESEEAIRQAAYGYRPEEEPSWSEMGAE